MGLGVRLFGWARKESKIRLFLKKEKQTHFCSFARVAQFQRFELGHARK
jgi:hypothetical protein